MMPHVIWFRSSKIVIFSFVVSFALTHTDVRWSLGVLYVSYRAEEGVSDVSLPPDVRQIGKMLRGHRDFDRVLFSPRCASPFCTCPLLLAIAASSRA